MSLPAIEEMKLRRQWVAWELRPNPGRPKPKKIPIDPQTGREASVSDPATWSTYDEAKAFAARHKVSGVGFVFTANDDLRGIDFDGCVSRDVGITDEFVAGMVKLGESYGEWSISGTGLHMIVRDDSLDAAKFDSIGLETYATGRFFVVTENHIEGTPTAIRPAPVTLGCVRARIAEAKAARAAASGSPKTVRGFEDEPASFFGRVNRAAMRDLAVWVPTLHPGARKTANGGFDIASEALGRPNEERYGFHPSGIVDFGVADMGDPREGKRTPIDAVLDPVLNNPPLATSPEGAALWLCEQLGVAPETPGYRRSTRSNVPDWLAQCKQDRQGNTLPTLENAMVALRSDPNVAECFAFDEMAKLPMLMEALPGGELLDAPRPLRDTDVSEWQEWAQRAGLSRLGRDTAHQAVDLRTHERQFHPVRRYLDGLRWDGTPRLAGWLHRYLGADATPYHAGVGRMFVICMVARIYEPGCKCDYMVILEGAQGGGKLSACRVLGGLWFSDNLPDLRDGKDLAQHLNGKWAIEVAELSAMSKAESAALKAFLSRDTERYRPSYGRQEVVQPRQCVFIGTTNMRAYLRDETGGRRFWPVGVGRIDLGALARDRDQLFAEAVALYRRGERWWPDAAFENEFIATEQEARFEADAWQDDLARWLRTQETALVGQAARCALRLETARLGRADQNRIVAIFERLGWERQRKDAKGNIPWARGPRAEPRGQPDDTDEFAA